MKARDFEHWMQGVQRRTEIALEQYLPPQCAACATLSEAMRHAVLDGGKRVRALLAHAAGELVDAPAEALDVVACALECIHGYSLVHDDMPCMDDDVLRRGKPTVHVAYGQATALLAGDALQAKAFELLSTPALALAAGQRLEMIHLLAHNSGAEGMVGGQALDLSGAEAQGERAWLEQTHRRKTGALIEAAILLGAHCGQPLTATAENALKDFGRHVGLLFQVVDDILDASADTAHLGKTAGKDAAQQKTTYVSVLGLEAARVFADSLLDAAGEALAPLGARAARLGTLANFIARRSF